MPQSIISQFSRAYNSPIEVNRQVATATERDAINSSVRWEGMLVYVVADGVTYELAGGISNGDWRELGGLQDAPSDGKIYGRKDGAWSIIDFSDEEIIDFTVTIPGLNSPETNITLNSWRCIRKGSTCTINGAVVTADGATWTDGGLALTLNGFPYGMKKRNSGIQTSFMCNFKPSAQAKVARCELGENGILDIRNLSPTSTVGASTIARNQWNDGTGGAEISLCITFELVEIV